MKQQITPEIKKSLASLAAQAGMHQAGKTASAYAEMIVETIEPQRVALQLFTDLFMPTRVLNPGDILVKRIEPRDVPVRVMVPGTKHLAWQLPPPSEVMSFGIDYLIAKVSYNMWQLRRGEVGDTLALQQRLYDALMDELVSRVIQLLSSVWSAGNTPDNFASVSTLNDAAIEGMVENVLRTAGSVRAIVGTRRALFPIYKFAGVFEHTVSGGTSPTNTQVVGIQSVLDEWSRTNRLGSFRGIRLVELPQVFKRGPGADYAKPLLPEDIILIIGDNAGEIILYGPTETQEHFDTSVEPPAYTLSLYQGFGMIVDYPERIGVIRLV